MGEMLSFRAWFDQQPEYFKEAFPCARCEEHLMNIYFVRCGSYYGVAIARSDERAIGITKNRVRHDDQAVLHDIPWFADRIGTSRSVVEQVVLAAWRD